MQSQSSWAVRRWRVYGWFALVSLFAAATHLLLTSDFLAKFSQILDLSDF